MVRKRKKKSKYTPSSTIDFTLINSKNPKQQNQLWRALHYVQYELAVSDRALKKEVITYAKNNKLDYKLLNVLPDAYLISLGRTFYILNRGGELTEKDQASVDHGLDLKMEQARKEKVKRKEAAKEKKRKSVGPVLTVQDRMREQAETIAAVFDHWIDDLATGHLKNLDTMDPATQMKLANFKAGQARWLKDYYVTELAEMKAIIAGDDAQLKEGYSNLKKSCVIRIAKLIDEIINAAAMIETVSTAQRKTRKKKLPTTAKLVAKLKYCKQHNGSGVASVDPVGIIGASEVWVYNTKYRKLGRYVARDTGGLGVKGTSIKDFATTSVQKTLRKPKEQLKDFMGCGKVKLRKFLNNIKAVDTKLNGRMNNNIVILKVIK